MGAAGWRWGRAGDPPCTVGSAPAPSLCVTGGGFEWDDDFPLMPVKPSLMSSLSGTPAEPDPSVPALLPAPKQVLPLQFSRFTVSPAPVSRFSITHVSDSDMDSIGGEPPAACPPWGSPSTPQGHPLQPGHLVPCAPSGTSHPWATSSLRAPYPVPCSRRLSAPFQAAAKTVTGSEPAWVLSC